MTLNEFKKAFAKIKSMGFVPSKRSGPTGIGYTLEKLLGLKENNIALPDLKNVELKAHRIDSTSLITLFTFITVPNCYWVRRQKFFMIRLKGIMSLWI